MGWTDIGDVASYTFRNLSPGTQYSVIVNAIHPVGAFEPAGRLFVTTLPAPPESDREDNDEDADDGPLAPTPTPIRDTLNHLQPGIHVNNWVEGAQGQRVGAAGVGRANVINHGILDAIDV